jgi:hypothetical protein
MRETCLNEFSSPDPKNDPKNALKQAAKSLLRKILAVTPYGSRFCPDSVMPAAPNSMKADNLAERCKKILKCWYAGEVESASSATADVDFLLLRNANGDGNEIPATGCTSPHDFFRHVIIT